MSSRNPPGIQDSPKSDPYLCLTPAGALHAYGSPAPDLTQRGLQALMPRGSLQRRNAWLAADPTHPGLLQEAVARNWVHALERELAAPDVRLDNYLPHAIAGLSASRTAALASEDGFCVARVGYSQEEADTLCAMAADFSGFIKRQHLRGWTGTGRAVAFHESIDMLMPTTNLCLFWVDGVGYWLILGGEPLLNNRALVDLIWGIRSAGGKFMV